MDYHEFLQSKQFQRRAGGFKPLWLPDCLFDFQRFLVDWSIRLGRSAIYADCGLGKSVMELVWAENVCRKTGKNVLILTPLAVGPQMVREGAKFGIECHRVKQGKVHRGISVTNYQQLERYSPEYFAGVVGDESSIIKNSDGKTRKLVTAFLNKIPYRLLCTATPAPNDFMELGTSSEALGVMPRVQMLGMFFTNQGESTQQWVLKGHAKKRFWEWVASWSRAVRRPSDLGFSDEGFILPSLNVIPHKVESTNRGRGFIPRKAKTLSDQRREKRDTIERRCEQVAQAFRKDGQALAWCQLNSEGDLLANVLNAVQVKGSDSDDYKEEVLNDFSLGKVKRLVTKSSIAGFGLNWQSCSQMSYFPTHCYDSATEILTKRGWLSFGDVTLHDEIATTNTKTLLFEWQNPTSVVWTPYQGKMIRFGSGESGSKSFDLLVTPNHRMFVHRCPTRYRSNNGWEFLPADRLMSKYRRQEYRMLSAPLAFEGIERDVVEITPYDRILSVAKGNLNKSGDRRGMSPRSWEGLNEGHLITIDHLLVKQFMQLAGWYLSEGHCGAKDGVLTGSIVITQTDVNPEHRREIIQLLHSIPNVRVYSKDKDIRICSIQLARFLVEQFGRGSFNKKIPRWVKEFPSRDLVVLRDTMLKGDGCSATRGGIKRFYRTVSKRLADDFSELCLKTGVRGSVHSRKMHDGRNDSVIWDVCLAWKNTRPHIHITPTEEDYFGMIGCVTVPNGTVIVRRNGIPVVSGNSHEQFYQAVRRCWRFGQKNEVDCHVVYSEAESLVYSNMVRKERQSNEMYAGICREMNSVGKREEESSGITKVSVPSWLKK